eukprot:TRINITY_DN6849_c0_g1_i1.p1 TRINITY_DN6849_c0_g1~~TRINITY_DN6849_c0_g1_i1.p1  ORF type:complete len:858 (-),score=204.72 TRINITY_DN6849_c0_g1_i1:108-2624(-)
MATAVAHTPLAAHKFQPVRVSPCGPAPDARASSQRPPLPLPPPSTSPQLSSAETNVAADNVFASLPVRAEAFQSGRLRVHVGSECVSFSRPLKGNLKVFAWVMLTQSTMARVPACSIQATDSGFTISFDVVQKECSCSNRAVNWIAFTTPVANHKFADLDKLVLASQTHIGDHLLHKFTKFLKVDSIMATGSDGHTLLHSAAYGGNAELIQLLLKKGANVNMTDDRGWTPLMMAVNLGKFTAAMTLLNSGAHADILNGKGFSVLHLLAKCRMLDTNSVELMRKLLEPESGLNVNTRNCDGETALMVGAGCSFTPVLASLIGILLEAKADPNIADNSDNTPLCKATHHNNTGLIDLLLKYSADPSKGPKNATPMDIAKSKNNAELVKRFEEEIRKRTIMTRTSLDDMLMPRGLSRRTPSVETLTSPLQGPGGNLPSNRLSIEVKNTGNAPTTPDVTHRWLVSSDSFTNIVRKISKFERKSKEDVFETYFILIPTTPSLPLLPAVYLPADTQDRSTYTFVFSYDSVDKLKTVMSWLVQLNQFLNVNILSYEYTGYGSHKGTSSFNQCVADLKYAVEYLIVTKNTPREQIILYGQGLGAVVSLSYAEQQASISDTAACGSIFLESALLSDVVIAPSAVKCPVVFIHGDMDDAVPLPKLRAFAMEYNSWTVVRVRGGMPALRYSFSQAYLPSVRFFIRSSMLEYGSTYGLTAVLRNWLARHELSGCMAWLASHHIMTIASLAIHFRNRRQAIEAGEDDNETGDEGVATGGGQAVVYNATVLPSETKDKLEQALENFNTVFAVRWDKLKQGRTATTRPAARPKINVRVPEWAKHVAVLVRTRT